MSQSLRLSKVHSLRNILSKFYAHYIFAGKFVRKKVVDNIPKLKKITIELYAFSGFHHFAKVIY